MEAQLVAGPLQGPAGGGGVAVGAGEGDVGQARLHDRNILDDHVDIGARDRIALGRLTKDCENNRPQP